MAVDEEFWRLPTVLKVTGLSRAQIYRRINDGSFPKAKSYRGGGRTVFWLSSDIRNWQQEELAAC
ncbi:AlpA family transcriptional regulator [Sphingopyxis sp. GW247-27LB]|uniref:helix-turn-helix transcriptional regulator n=1 Tax=Sphingopyxis sp. GW247-27LB TaxID=2012632 RepID=UPI000BA6DF00|nr:AlpA family phage regulatory protein [Sphingopyxis sp. GW247-27LB]PAL23522.1 AlpA family transcriptional regulator [Sphingopyxis sp. GW247-27LB]